MCGSEPAWQLADDLGAILSETQTNGKDSSEGFMPGEAGVADFNHSGLDSPQLAAFVIPAEAGIQFFKSGFPPTRE